MRMMTRW